MVPNLAWRDSLHNTAGYCVYRDMSADVPKRPSRFAQRTGDRAEACPRSGKLPKAAQRH
jgi:hypothetical protein